MKKSQASSVYEYKYLIEGPKLQDDLQDFLFRVHMHVNR